MPQQEPVHINRKQIRQIVEHFDGKPVTNEVVREYCNLHKLEYISAGAIEDWRFQFASDMRVAKFVPAALKVIQKYVPVPELMGEDDRKKLIDQNDLLSVELCQMMSEHGILYQEIDLVCKNIGNVLQSIFNDAAVRANNMASVMLANAAEDKYGRPLTVKALVEGYAVAAKKNAATKK